MILSQSPHAGRPWRKNTAVKVAAAVAAAMVLACCGGGVTLALLGHKFTNEGQNPASGSADSGAAGKMGQAVDGRQFQFTVSEVKCGIPSMAGTSGYSPLGVAKGQYCLVTLAVKNISRTPIAFLTYNETVNGPDGGTYEPDRTVTPWVNKGNMPFFNRINPGDSQTGIVAFDVPKDIALTNVKILEGRTNWISIAVTSATAAVVTGKAGQALDGHELQFTVSKIKCGVKKVGSPDALYVDPKGQFCVAPLTVKNITGASVMFQYTMASAKGPDGAAYHPDSASMLWANYDKKDDRTPFFGYIAPGESLSAVMVFDIPKNLTLTGIDLPDGATDRVSITVS